MSRPEYHVDVATAAAPTAVAQPPSGIQTTGFPAHSKFASTWANWLFGYLGDWSRELDQSSLRAADVLSDTEPQHLQNSGTGFALPENAGLANLLPEAGGAYVLAGRRVDLSVDALISKYPTGWTLPASASVYAHAREELGFGGSSTGEILLSENPTEAGYDTIWAGITNGVNLVAQESLASPSLIWQAPIDLTGPVTIEDPNDETALIVVANNTGLTPAVYIDATAGDGAGLQIDTNGNSSIGLFTGVAAGTSAVGVRVNMSNSPAGASGVLVNGNSGTAGAGIDIVHAGTGAGIEISHASSGVGLISTSTGTGAAANFVGSATGSVAVNVSSTGGGNTIGLITTGQGTGDALRAVGSTGSGNAIRATMANGTGMTILAQTGGGLSQSTQRALKAEAFGSASAIEAEAIVGWPLILKGASVSPTAAEIKFSGQGDDPSDVFDGQMMWHTGERQFKVSDASDMTYRGIHTSIGGRARGYDKRGVITAPNTWTLAGMVILEDSNAPKLAGRRANIRFTCDARTTTNVVNQLNLRLRAYAGNTFVANTGVVVTYSGSGGGAQAGYELPALTSLGWGRSVVFSYDYTIPAAGDRVFVIEFEPSTMISVQVRDPLLLVDGLY